MANNEYVNKVLFGNTTVMDISDTTAEEGDVIEGQTFYTKSGAPATGTLSDATTTTHGLMSTTDKAKLDGIDTTNYTLVPIVSATDNGKILQVSNGEWAAEELSIPIMTSTVDGLVDKKYYNMLNNGYAYLYSNLIKMDYAGSNVYRGTQSAGLILGAWTHQNYNMPNTVNGTIVGYILNGPDNSVETVDYRAAVNYSINILGASNKSGAVSSLVVGKDNYISGANSIISGTQHIGYSITSVVAGFNNEIHTRSSLIGGSNNKGYGTDMLIFGAYNNITDNMSNFNNASQLQASTTYTAGTALYYDYYFDSDTSHTKPMRGYITINENDLTTPAMGGFINIETDGLKGKFLEIVGNGTGDSARSNARVLTWTGDERLNGNLYVNCNADSTGGQKVATEAYVTSATSIMTGATSSANGTAGLIPAPTTADAEKFFRGDGTWQDGGRPMVILSYGNSTWDDFITAYNNRVIVYCRASSNSNPKTGSQTRMAFMAYVNNAETPTEVEFQYYRSMSSHSATQMGDQVYVYKLTNKNAWTVTVREASVKQVNVSGSGLTASWSNNQVTLSNTMTAADMPMSSSDATTVDSAISGQSQDIANLSGKVDTEIITSLPFRTGVFYCASAITIGSVTLPSYCLYDLHTRSNDGAGTAVRVTNGTTWSIYGYDGAWVSAVQTAKNDGKLNEYFYSTAAEIPTTAELSSAVTSISGAKTYVMTFLSRGNNNEARSSMIFSAASAAYGGGLLFTYYTSSWYKVKNTNRTVTLTAF